MAGWYVTANDIKVWTASSKRRAEEILPLLVKKLIMASSKPLSIDFPSGDSVAIGGWDGTLHVEQGNDFIPSGKSGWEIGTNDNVKKKADDDYTKRTEEPAPYKLKETSFVFVTSRLWTRRDNWVREKRNDNQWKDVRGLNAEDLQNWLEQCPAVHRWFSEIIGKRTPNIFDINQAWGTFSNTTKVKLTSEFFLYERNDSVEKLSNLLSGQPSVIRVKSRLINEAYGFILSIVKNNPTFSNRCLIVRKQEDWDYMMESKQSLILIPKDFNPNGLGATVANGHIVLMAIDESNSAVSTIDLEHPQREIRTNAIKKLGFDDMTANLIYQETKGYLNPLMRHPLMQPIDYNQPDWPETCSTNILFAILFATEWREDNEKDREIMELLSGITYQEFEQEILKLCTLTDPPIRKVGSVWQVISKIDLWLQIASNLSMPNMERLGKAVQKVFIDLDPSYDLPSEERYMANIKGAIPLYTNLLKQGLAESLAMIAAYGDDFSRQTGDNKPSTLISYWVKQIFETNKDTQLWYSIRNITSLIAESAPEAFLDSVEKSSQGSSSPILGLFKEETDGTFGACYHSGLLWGLEVIAWNKKYLSRVSLCLARLAQIDPGGSWANRPFNTLVDIYLGWINNIPATHEERVLVIEQVLLPNYPDITWDLMKNLLLKNTRVTSGISKPRYREWSSGYNKKPLLKTYHNYIRKIVNIMIREVAKKPEDRICDLIENFNSYDDEQQDKVINYLLGIKANELSDEIRCKILSNLRDILSHHREYPNTKWSWPESLLAQLEKVYNNLDFDNAVKRNLYLFDEYWPKLIEPLSKKELDYKEREKFVEKKRLDSVIEIYRAYGKEGILELALSCELPMLVGEISYKSSIKEELFPMVLECLENKGHIRGFVNGFIAIFAIKDFKTAIGLLDNNWKEDKKVNYLLHLPANHETISRVEELSAATRNFYWENVGVDRLLSQNVSEVMYTVLELRDVNRLYTALYLINKMLHINPKSTKIKYDVVASILIDIATKPCKEKPYQNIHYQLKQSIELIQNSREVSKEVIIQIEWLYTKILGRYHFSPKHLIKKVVVDPIYLSQLVSWAYNRSDGNEDPKAELTETLIRQRAEISFKLLNMVSILPGQSGNDINNDFLNDWIDVARESLRKRGRMDVGDIVIGNILSNCPNGADGVWPHESVREVIERLKSEKIENGIITGLFNARGVTVRNPYTGGRQERKLAEAFYSDAESIQLIYPRTSEMLRSIARSYEREADREDREVELLD